MNIGTCSVSCTTLIYSPKSLSRFCKCDLYTALANCMQHQSTLSDWIFNLLPRSASALFQTVVVISTETLLKGSWNSLISFCIVAELMQHAAWSQQIRYVSVWWQCKSCSSLSASDKANCVDVTSPYQPTGQNRTLYEHYMCIRAHLRVQGCWNRPMTIQLLSWTSSDRFTRLQCRILRGQCFQHGWALVGRFTIAILVWHT